ncbi:40S ribosomal protein S18 [Platanthera zijinensis]|uniref:40S ribosomal protein S18 n=1 Tax=Platanthera zijinensis TaxID=2320716 RepID=A0AAP0BQ01_9ASPA
MLSLISIKFIGRRFPNIICKKADVDMNKRSLSLRYTIYFSNYVVFRSIVEFVFHALDRLLKRRAQFRV